MPTKHVQGYLGIEDELDNLDDYRPVTIQLEGYSLPPKVENNLLPISMIAVGVVGGLAIIGARWHKKKAST